MKNNSVFRKGTLHPVASEEIAWSEIRANWNSKKPAVFVDSIPHRYDIFLLLIVEKKPIPGNYLSDVEEKFECDILNPNIDFWKSLEEFVRYSFPNLYNKHINFYATNTVISLIEA